MANLPVELVRRLHPGATVITSDVGRKLELRSDAFPAEAEVSGWHAVRARIGRRQKVPGVVRILAQLTALGGAGSRQERGDLHIDFDLARFGMFDFKKADAIIEAGYRQSLAALDQSLRGAGMIRAIGAAATRFPKRMLGVLVLALVLFGVVGGGVEERLSVGGFVDPNAESTKVADALEERFETGVYGFVLVLRPFDEWVYSESNRAEGERITAALEDEAGVVEVASYYNLPEPGVRHQPAARRLWESRAGRR